MAQANSDPAKSKTVAAMRLRNELGGKSKSNCTLHTLTKEGEHPIPRMGEDQAHSDLGVMVHFGHHRTAAATFAKSLAIIKERSSSHL